MSSSKQKKRSAQTNSSSQGKQLFMLDFTKQVTKETDPLPLITTYKDQARESPQPRSPASLSNGDSQRKEMQKIKAPSLKKEVIFEKVDEVIEILSNHHESNHNLDEK